MTQGAGIIGFGFMGQAHAAGYQAARAGGLPVELRAVTGARGIVPPDGAEVMSGVDALLAREDISLVSICTPTDTHVDIATAALAAGKHILLEKPVALRSEDVMRLADVADASGRVCLPAMCMRFWPGWPWLRARVREGDLGPVRRASFTRLAARPAWGGGFYQDHARSGGALVDLHIHDVDFIRWCFGDPVGLASTGSRTDVTTTYRFPSGAEIRARGAWLPDPSTVFTMRYEVEFEAALARFDAAAPEPLRLRHDAGEEPVPIPAANAYDLEVRHFVELAMGRSSEPVATLEEAIAVTRLLEAEAHSLEWGGSVALPRAAG
jgi:predicted dehydrogenase